MIVDRFKALRAEIQKCPGEGFAERIDTLWNDFSYMTEYMMKGYSDPMRQRLYNDIVTKLGYLEYDILVYNKVNEVLPLAVWRRRQRGRDLSAETLQAMLLREESTEEHYETLTTAFLALLTSYHWNALEQEEWQKFLISANVNSLDANTLISALTLSAMAVSYSAEKIMCLMNISMKAEDEMVRQRAFVGCVLAIIASVNDARAKDELLIQLMAEERIANEMMELQMQMINCAQAEEVSQKINRDIMPNIVNNQPFKITRNGIEEREEESDILDPGSVDRKMDLMEENVRKMMNMQENGADIFFGGFKQMKRFSFFNKVMNWFIPFYIEHPDLKREAEQIKGSKFVDKVIKQGPFCESDKYSFFIAFTSVFSKLTDEMKKLMDNGEMGPLGMHEDVKEVQSPAFRRRQYLQDLYRFFRLNAESKYFGNPFDNANECPVWVMTAPYFTEKELREVGKYLIRRKNPKTLEKVLDCCKNLEGTFLYFFLSAEVNRMLGNYDIAASLYKSALSENPSHMPTMSGYAKTLYALKDYKKAATFFDALRTQKPDRRSYTMNYIMAMTMSGQAESIMNDIYKLDFENPNDLTIKNVLGWVLLYAGKKEKALELYDALLRGSQSSQDILSQQDNSSSQESYLSPQVKQASQNDPSILFNALYAYMANGKMQEAQDVLASCTQVIEKKQLWSNMQDDLPMLKQYGIGEAELEIIISFVCYKE